MRSRVVNISDYKLFKVNISSIGGRNIYLKFPVEFIKKVIKIDGLKFLNLKIDSLEAVDLKKTIEEALDCNLTGNIVDLNTKNNDLIKITIE